MRFIAGVSDQVYFIAFIFAYIMICPDPMTFLVEELPMGFGIFSGDSLSKCGSFYVALKLPFSLLTIPSLSFAFVALLMHWTPS